MTWLWEWEELATDAVVDWLYRNAGIDIPQTERSSQVPVALSALLRVVGGVAVAEERPDPETLVEALVEAACRHVLRKTCSAPAVPGVVLLPDGEGRLRAHATPVLDINAAAVAALAALPVLGPVLARAIVEERRARGRFAGPDDLERRVGGLGPALVERLGTTLTYGPGAPPTVPPAQPGSAFAAVVATARHPNGPADHVLAALDLLCSVCAAQPHPASADGRPHPATLDQPEPPAHESDELELLADGYHGVLLDLIGHAAESVDVCMFHIALGGPNHPTRLLVAALGEAVQRGVAVRVLVDRDRRTDPYRSTVVNRPAVEFLGSLGVPVRSDREDRLLHSKFAIFDHRWTVIGSHNWSAGSFEEFDDVSLLIDGVGIAGTQTSRFDELWASAQS